MRTVVSVAAGVVVVVFAGVVAVIGSDLRDKKWDEKNFAKPQVYKTYGAGTTIYFAAFVHQRVAEVPLSFLQFSKSRNAGNKHCYQFVL